MPEPRFPSQTRERKNALQRQWKLRSNPGRGARTQPVPCPVCGAADSRDAPHAAGCPTLPALSREELLWHARRLEFSWGPP